MGDNHRRARAWPEREGKCSDCGRWIRLSTERGATMPIVNLHRCSDGRKKRNFAVEVYEPNAETTNG